MSGYYLVDDKMDLHQHTSDTTFIGGKPCLPHTLALPVCQLCGASQTFFFQAAFPADHKWSGLSLAIFACTECADEDNLIPEMLSVPLFEASVPDGFLQDYQRNFRIFVFPTTAAQWRQEYREKIQFKRWMLEPALNVRTLHNKLAGSPDWLLEDESPSTYQGSKFVFLLQITMNFQFDILPDAPPQMVIDYFGDGQAQAPSEYPYYELFIGNALYLFGTESLIAPQVYALTQVE